MNRLKLSYYINIFLNMFFKRPGNSRYYKSCTKLYKKLLILVVFKFRVICYMVMCNTYKEHNLDFLHHIEEALAKLENLEDSSWTKI